MNLPGSEWYPILLFLVIAAAVITNEIGIGGCTFPPLAILGYWLMIKAFGVKEHDGES